MRLRCSLFLAAMVFFVIPLPAQESLPPSYLQFLKTQDHLQAQTPNDIRELASKAQAGAADAQYQLALVYAGAGPVPRDEAASRRWMLKAAEQGYVAAEAEIGMMYLNNHREGPAPDYADADRWLRLAANEGDAQAQFWLGEGYRRGFYGGVDYEEAREWLRKAADQGLPDAEFCLGQMYKEGDGVPESDEMAAQWYRKAADHYSDLHVVFLAEIQLLCMYREGRLKRNDVEAYMWAAVIGCSTNPPSNEDMKQIAKHMTKAEIAQAQQKARDWIEHHPWRPE